MFLADVIGTVVSPIQIPILDRQKLLLVRPLPGHSPARARIAIDRVGAGTGDRVLVLDEGNSAREIFGDPKGAVKTIIVGIVDSVEIEGRVVYDHRTGPTPAAGTEGGPR